MYYQELENLLNNTSLSSATESDVEVIDKYLATLNINQAIKLSPWRVAKKTGIGLDAVIEILLHAAKLNLLSIRYEIWHPISRITLFTTFDPSIINQPVECNDEPSGQYIPTDHDIHISFRLNQIQSINDSSDTKKKELKANMSQNENPHEDAHNETTTLDQIKANSHLSQTFHDCAIHITQTGDYTNTAQSGGTITQTVKNDAKEKTGIFSLLLQHPLISAVIAGLIIALITATGTWKAITNYVSSYHTTESIRATPGKMSTKIRKSKTSNSIDKPTPKLPSA